MDANHYKKLQNMFRSANINHRIYDTQVLTVEDSKAVLTLDVSDHKYFHSLGAIHGSVYFKMLDDSSFFAVASVVPDVFPLTSTFNVNLLRPANTGTAKAVGVLKFKSQNIYMAESTLYNEEGKVIAFGSGSFAKSKIPLTEEIGYRL